MAISKQQVLELDTLLRKFADDLGETIDEEKDEDAIEILRPIYRLTQELGNALEPIT